MQRRDFLQPRRLAQTAGPLLAALEPEPVPAPPAELSLLRFSRRAMATGFEIALPLGTDAAFEAADAGLDLIDQLEAQLTVYRDTSEVSRLNRSAAFGPLPVEAGLFDLLSLAARIHTETGGAYDIAVGALIKAWGFFRRAGRVPSEAERAEVLTRCGMRHVVLDPDRRTVQYRVRGVEINLGSIGKGYALDRVAQRLRGEWNVASGLVHGGTSSVLALGTPPGQPAGWAVGLGHPWDLRRRLGVVQLRDRALGTSSITFQHLEHQGRKLGHILDPRSGWPAEALASATVVAPTAAEADALATAFFVLGVEPARIYCQDRPELGAVLLPAGAAAPLTVGNVDFSPFATSSSPLPAGERGRG
jgi:thiamine biosynthesis lipoprotein